MIKNLRQQPINSDKKICNKLSDDARETIISITGDHNNKTCN